MKEIQDKLFAFRDDGNRDFLARLVPTVPKDRILGVRSPNMRALAKEYKDTAAAEEYMKELPHRYLEENSLHGLFIEQIKDYDRVVRELDIFLPYVDNWASCDAMSPKIFKKHTEELLPVIRRWIGSERTYTVRFGIEMLMSFYLDGEFKKEYLDMVAPLRSEEYYVNMMIAWFFATALAKQYDAALPYLEKRALAPWVHNKSIQKAIESYRISDEQKAYLRTLKIKA